MRHVPGHGYRIDYANVDVDDLMEQVRERARRQMEAAVDPAAVELEGRDRLREWLDLDDERPYELQQELGLEGDWNVTPEDLRTSHPNLAGRLISMIRILARPIVKLLVNLDLPLYKQFKVNLGMAAALDRLQRDNAELRRRVRELEARLEAPDRADEVDRRRPPSARR
ncbi:MAG: hypothetical protein ACOC5E_01365 [Acidobacteriota bacterium]